VPGKEVRYRNGLLIVADAQNGEDVASVKAVTAALPSPKKRFQPPVPPAMPAKSAPPAPTLF
jgi:hypothetical protein